MDYAEKRKAARETARKLVRSKSRPTRGTAKEDREVRRASRKAAAAQIRKAGGSKEERKAARKTAGRVTRKRQGRKTK